MNIIHTAGHEMGQIYIPLVNWSLAVASIAAVIGFGSSHALAGAYGIAVSLLMVITTLLATFVALHWKHDPSMVYIVNGSFLALNLVFFASASTKLLDGGWFPLGIALIIVFLMLTWRKGEEIMDKVRMEVRQSSKSFIDQLNVDPPFRIPGSAVVLGRMMRGVPLALTHNLKVNHVLHQKVFLIAVETTERPVCRTKIESRSHQFPTMSSVSCCASASWSSRTFLGASQSGYQVARSRQLTSSRSPTIPATRRLFPPDCGRGSPPGVSRYSPSCIITHSGPVHTSRFRARRSWK